MLVKLAAKFVSRRMRKDDTQQVIKFFKILAFQIKSRIDAGEIGKAGNRSLRPQTGSSGNRRHFERERRLGIVAQLQDTAALLLEAGMVVDLGTSTISDGQARATVAITQGVEG